MLLMSAFAGSQALEVLPAGVAIRAEQVRSSDLPGPDAIGRVPRTPVYAGEIVREERLFPVGTEPGAAPLVPAGLQLAELEVAPRGTRIDPGDHVDLFDRSALCTVASDALVIAVQVAGVWGFPGTLTPAARRVQVAVPHPLPSHRRLGILLRHPTDRGPAPLPACEAY